MMELLMVNFIEYLHKIILIRFVLLMTLLLLFIVQVLPRPVQHEITFACQHFSTQITGIAECVWEMLGLHVFSDMSSGFVGKSFTQSTVVLVCLIIFLYKLLKLRRVLKCLA